MDGDREVKKRKKNTAESPFSDQGSIVIHGIWHVIFAQLNTHQQQAVRPTTAK